MNASVPQRQRPPGATALAGLLTWLAVGGIGNAFVWHFIPPEMAAYSESHLGDFLSVMTHPAFSLLMLAYGLAAAASAVGLWQMKGWVRMPFKVWGVTVALTSLAISAIRPIRMPEQASLSFVPIAIFSMLLWYVLWRYVDRLAPERPTDAR